MVLHAPGIMREESAAGFGGGLPMDRTARGRYLWLSGRSRAPWVYLLANDGSTRAFDFAARAVKVGPTILAAA